MKHFRVCFVLWLALLYPYAFTGGTLPAGEENVSTVTAPAGSLSNFDLSSTNLDKEIFSKALEGYNSLKQEQKVSNEILTVIDFSQSSNKNRLFIIDVKNQKLILQTLVAHGRNSGEEFATKFSNVPGSYMSSPGFYLTGETYHGKHGLSLLLKGIDKGINDNAESRAIVVHGASYVSDDFIKKHGRLGRSQGCPAVSEKLAPVVIDLIKGGSCIYIHRS